MSAPNQNDDGGSGGGGGSGGDDYSFFLPRGIADDGFDSGDATPQRPRPPPHTQHYLPLTGTGSGAVSVSVSGAATGNTGPGAIGQPIAPPGVNALAHSHALQAIGLPANTKLTPSQLAHLQQLQAAQAHALAQAQALALAQQSIYKQQQNLILQSAARDAANAHASAASAVGTGSATSPTAGSSLVSPTVMNAISVAPRLPIGSKVSLSLRRSKLMNTHAHAHALPSCVV